MQRTANPGNPQHTLMSPEHYLARAHALRSATFAHAIDALVRRVTGHVGRAVQWLNSHPVIS
ncbi:MAG: hypothetical protein DWQ11_02170 [Proteobacteria bacterium]|nr:MAG: hypothetical protein DWQ11_02170 [Pseudomonadota bacterium]